MANVFDITCGIPLHASQNHLSCCPSPSIDASLRRVSVRKTIQTLHVSTSLKHNIYNASNR